MAYPTANLPMTNTLNYKSTLGGKSGWYVFGMFHHEKMISIFPYCSSSCVKLWYVLICIYNRIVHNIPMLCIPFRTFVTENQLSDLSAKMPINGLTTMSIRPPIALRTAFWKVFDHLYKMVWVIVRHVSQSTLNVCN
jgi:hypothetical protein